MNSHLEKFARDTLKDDLAMCTVRQRYIFRRMYAHGHPTDLPMNVVVDDMPQDKLDWAMMQVKRTLEKNHA